MITKSNPKNKLQKVQQTLLITLIAFSLLSCESQEINDDLNHNNVATFTSTINKFIMDFANTRAAGNTWQKNDNIGIFAIEANQELSEQSIYNNYNNVKYINKAAGEAGNFIAVDTEILFPANDQKLDFIAYYPYTPNGSALIFPVDISIQDPQSAIDIMYATKKGHSWENPNVEFQFKHLLSTVVIQLTSDEGISLEDATITFQNAHTNANIHLVDGEVTLDTIKSSITPIIHYDATKDEITAKAILLPGENLSNLNIQIQLANDDSYSWTPDQYILKPHFTRLYKFNLTYNEIELMGSGSTIEDWEVDEDGTIHILKPDTENSSGEPTDPENENPDASDEGTRENPYTVEQAIENQGKEAWVEGYIMGYAIRESVGGGFELITDDLGAEKAEANIVLADDISESDISHMIPLEFNASNELLIEELSLKENPELLGQRVKIFCKLEKYWSGPGGRSISAYEFIEEDQQD